MRVKVSEIDIDLIDLGNDCYRNRSCYSEINQDHSDLVQSIESFGILNPPILSFESGSYIVVSGKRRIEVAKRIGHKTLLCQVFNDTALNLYKIAVVENLNTGTYSELDKALIVSRFADLSKDQANTDSVKYTDNLPSGLRINKDYAQRLLKLNCLSDSIKISIAKGYVSPSIALEYDLRDGNDHARVIFYLETLKMGLNLQREFCNLVLEISKISDSTMSDVLSDDILTDIIEGSQEMSKKRELVICELRKIRFPQIEKCRKSFADTSAKLVGKNSDISILPPKNFESNSVSLTFSFNNTERFRKNLAVLERLCEEDDFNLLFSSMLNL